MIDARPNAFSPHASGLYVPDEIARAREVWTRQEWKALDKVTAFLEARGISVHLGCTHPDCTKAPITRHRRLDGGMSLRCNHKERDVIPGI